MAIDIGDMIVSPWQNKEKSERNDLNSNTHTSPTWTTKTGVDRQDYYTLEDFAADPSLKDNMDVKAMLGDTGLQLLQNSYAKDIVNYLLDAGEGGSWRPDNTVKDSDDYISKGVKKLKDKKYKLIKMHSKLGQYNSLLNLAGTAAGMFVGTLGLGGMAIANDLGGVALSSLPTGMLALSGLQALYKGVQAIKRSGEGVVQTALPPSGKEILSLAIANYYNILSSKPGLLVKSWRKNSEDAFTNTSLNKFVSKLRTEKKLINNSEDAFTNTSLNKFVSKLRSEKELINNESFLNYDKNYNEYITGDYSPFDEIIKKEEPIEDEVREIAISPSKNNQEKELNNSSKKNLLKDISIDVVDDQDYHYLSEEELDLFKEHYAYFGESDGVYTTGSYKTASGKIWSYQRLKEADENSQKYLNEKKDPYKSIEPHRKETLINANVGSSFKTAEVYNYKINELLYKYDTNTEKKDFVKECLERVNQTYYKIGCLHILPFYNSNGTLKTFDIPFEFNPVINEGASTATYQEENLLGRIIPIKSYTKTAPGDITLELTYMALSPDKIDNNIPEELLTSNKLTWMNTWTPKHLRNIENQLRSLTLPYIEESDFVRPPVVSIDLNSDSAVKGNENSKVSELFTYPTTGDKLQITKKLQSGGANIHYKRYVVKSVNISPLNNSFGNSYIYNSDEIKRYGFKVSLSLSETTINFLDLIPSYKQYIGDKPEETIDADPSEWNWTSLEEEQLDLWTCLNEPSSVGFNYVNIRQGFKKFPFPPLVNEKTDEYMKNNIYNFSGLIVAPYERRIVPELFKDEISSKDVGSDLLKVDDKNNKRKPFDTYKEQLMASPSISGDVGKLIELFKDSDYWNRNNKYINWLYGVGEKSSFDDFDEDWESYIAALNKIYPEDGFERFAKYAKKSEWYNKPETAKYLTESNYRINVLYDNGLKVDDIFSLFEKSVLDKSEQIKKLTNTYYFMEDKAKKGRFLSWLKNGSFDYYNKNYKSYYADLLKAGFNGNDIYFLLGDSKWKEDCEVVYVDPNTYGGAEEKQGNTLILKEISFDKWLELFEKHILSKSEDTDYNVKFSEYMNAVIDNTFPRDIEGAKFLGEEVENTMQIYISADNYFQFLKWISKKVTWLEETDKYESNKKEDYKKDLKDKLKTIFTNCYNTVFKDLKKMTNLDFEDNNEDANYTIWADSSEYNPPWCKISYAKPIEEKEDNSDLPTQAELYDYDGNNYMVSVYDCIYCGPFLLNNLFVNFDFVEEEINRNVK